MKKISKNLQDILFFLIFQLLIIFLCTTLNIFFLNTGISSIILIMTNVIWFLIIGLKFGIRAKKKGLTTGLIIGAILVIFLFIIHSIIYDFQININQLLYYSILILSSTLGGIIGKNKQKTNIQE
jgi:putative membrane protein (TIGR04086 family)